MPAEVSSSAIKSKAPSFGNNIETEGIEAATSETVVNTDSLSVNSENMLELGVEKAFSIIDKIMELF